MNNVLKSIYYDEKHPASYSSAVKLYIASHLIDPSITLRYVKDWLSGEITNTLYKPVRRHFKRNPIIVKTIDQQWEDDLVDMQEFTRQNRGYRYILTVIDCLSKYAWVASLKNKKSDTIIEAFRNIFEIDFRSPEYLRTDKGREFNNEKFKKFLKRYYVNYFTSKNNDIKCAIIERFNRTLKSKMFKHFTAKNTLNFIQYLPKFITAYNSSFHRTIKTEPINAKNSKQLFKTIYQVNNVHDLKINKKPINISSNDTVRKAYEKKAFDRSFRPQWTDQTFTVDSIKPAPNKPFIIINEQRYYPEQLQKIKDNKFYRIEKIIKSKRENRRLMHFVKWIGYPTSANSWIYASDIEKYN
jgi:hypothetical protein